MAKVEYDNAISARRLGNFEKASAGFAEVASSLQSLRNHSVLKIDLSLALQALRDEIALTELCERTIGDWTQIENLTDYQRAFVCLHRVTMYAQRKDLTEANRTLNRWAASRPTDPDGLYLLARGYGALSHIRWISATSRDEHNTQAAVLIDAGLATLQAAVEAGFSDFEQVSIDADIGHFNDLFWFRERPAFTALLEKHAL